jgi:hypothetical protein
MKSTAPVNGIVYVAFGYRYLAMAIRSALSAQRFELSTQIVTNQKWFSFELAQKLGIKDLHIVYLDEPDSENRMAKVNCFYSSYFDNTLYLDCDTLIMRDLRPLFEIIQNYDFCVRVNSHPFVNTNKYVFDLPFNPEAFSHFNGGVFGFTKSLRTKVFFDTWAQYYSSLGNSADQPALASALFTCRKKLRILGLNGLYNFTPNYTKINSSNPPYIIHYPLNTYHAYNLMKMFVLLKRLSPAQPRLTLHRKWVALLIVAKILDKFRGIYAGE